MNNHVSTSQSFWLPYGRCGQRLRVGDPPDQEKQGETPVLFSNMTVFTRVHLKQQFFTMPPFQKAQKTCFLYLIMVLKTQLLLMSHFDSMSAIPSFIIWNVFFHSLLKISLWILRDMFQKKVTLWVSVIHVTSFTSEQCVCKINQSWNVIAINGWFTKHLIVAL